MGGSEGGGWERGEARERLGHHHPIFFGGTPYIDKMLHIHTTIYNFIVSSFKNIVIVYLHISMIFQI